MNATQERGPAKAAWGAGGLKNQYNSSQATLGSDDNMGTIVVSYLTELRLKSEFFAGNNSCLVIVAEFYTSLSTPLPDFLA